MKKITEFTFRYFAFPVLYLVVLTWATLFGALAGVLHYIEFTATMAKSTHIQLLQRFGMLPKQPKTPISKSLDKRIAERKLQGKNM